MISGNVRFKQDFFLSAICHLFLFPERLFTIAKIPGYAMDLNPLNQFHGKKPIYKKMYLIKSVARQKHLEFANQVLSLN